MKMDTLIISLKNSEKGKKSYPRRQEREILYKWTLRRLWIVTILNDADEHKIKCEEQHQNTAKEPEKTNKKAIDDEDRVSIIEQKIKDQDKGINQKIIKIFKAYLKMWIA